jgi:hypothetical protein
MEEMGEIDPLFGVVAWKGKRKTSLDAWTDEAFY